MLHVDEILERAGRRRPRVNGFEPPAQRLAVQRGQGTQGFHRQTTELAGQTIADEKLERAKGFEPSTPTLAKVPSRSDRRSPHYSMTLQNTIKTGFLRILNYAKMATVNSGFSVSVDARWTPEAMCHFAEAQSCPSLRRLF
jgi:hypothetical protein